MLYDSNASRDVYVVFHDDCDYVCSQYIQPGFRHVFAIERQALGWLCFDPSREDIHSLILPASYDTDVMTTFKKNNPEATVIHLRIKKSNRASYPRPGMLSCVGVIQYFIGVWWPHVLTPYMLHNKLLSNTPPHLEVII